MEEHIIELEEEVLGHHVGAEEDAAGEHHTAIDVKRLWRAQNQPETVSKTHNEILAPSCIHMLICRST